MRSVGSAEADWVGRPFPGQAEGWWTHLSKRDHDEEADRSDDHIPEQKTDGSGTTESLSRSVGGRGGKGEYGRMGEG